MAVWKKYRASISKNTLFSKTCSFLLSLSLIRWHHSIFNLGGVAAGEMSLALFSSVLYVCVNCVLVLNPVRSISYRSLCLELYQFNYIRVSRRVAFLSVRWPVCLPSVYVTDDEVCLGQLQALRLGQEWAAAFDEERAHWQHVWWVSAFCSRLKQPERSANVCFFHPHDLLTVYFLKRFYSLTTVYSRTERCWAPDE